ncbi:MAG: acyltransferase [Deltaproteobacteria bacterium HGW-Deltaproteobacteria-1]|nr:MAG: acyltransferase [Deltaproteobacteria bacterium HGW-Deltaproteobacteria-1]
MQNPPATFRHDIQGLRAIAILSIIAFHYDSEILPGGFIGVDVFLVISGYLIISGLISKKVAGHNFSEILRYFFWNRVKRIAPAYYTLLVVVSLVAAILFIPPDFFYYRDSLKKSLYFFSNNYFAGFGDYFAPNANELPLLHTWALAVEMQFYLVISFAVLFIPIGWLKKLIPFAVVFFALIAEYMIRVQGETQSTYYALYARIPEFLIGGWLAIQQIGAQWSERKASIAAFTGLVLIFASAIFITSDAPFPGLLAFLPCIGAALIICAQRGMPYRFLSLPVLVWLGAISYSLYLWHWPVLAFLRYYTGAYDLNIAATGVFTVTTLILSCCTYYFIEEVFRSKRAPARVWVPMTTVLVLTVVSINLATSAINKTLTEPLPVELTQYADQKEICHGHIKGSCLRGKDQSDTNILVLGDSHAAMLNHFFDVAGKELGITVRIITASACVNIPGFDYQRIPNYAHEPCRQQIDFVKKTYLDQASVILLAAQWSYHFQNEDFLNALTEFLERKGANGRQKILLLSQIPRFKKHPLRARRFASLGMPTELPKDDCYIAANSTIKKLADKYEHVQYVDLTKLSVFDSAPMFKGTLMYHDEHHLNEYGAKLYGKFAAPLLRQYI